MRPTQALKWLGEQLHSIDKMIPIKYVKAYAHKDGIQVKFYREIRESEDAATVLQPPILQDKIRDLLDTVGSFQVSFNVKHYPNPVPKGMSKPTMYGPAREFYKNGGWGYGGEGTNRKRDLYDLGVIIHLTPVMAPNDILGIIKDALLTDRWTQNERHLKGKCESKLFAVGEQVVRLDNPVPGEVLYFVTSYAIPGGGGPRVLKIGKNGRQSFISLPAAIRVGA